MVKNVQKPHYGGRVIPGFDPTLCPNNFGVYYIIIYRRGHTVVSKTKFYDYQETARSLMYKWNLNVIEHAVAEICITPSYCKVIPFHILTEKMFRDLVIDFYDQTEKKLIEQKKANNSVYLLHEAAHEMRKWVHFRNMSFAEWEQEYKND